MRNTVMGMMQFPSWRIFGISSRPGGCSCRSVGGARPGVVTDLVDVPTQRMFGAVPLVWICNPDPLSIGNL